MTIVIITTNKKYYTMQDVECISLSKNKKSILIDHMGMRESIEIDNIIGMYFK